MGRDYVYLGKRVPDTGKKGLDNLGEVRGIRDAIIEDRRKGRIDSRTAASRMNLLKLVVSRDSDFQGAKKQKALSAVDKGIQKLKNMNRRKKAGSSRKGRKSRGKR